MASELLIQVYRELADCFERQGDAGQRDTFLVLAADASAQAGRHDEAERLRLRLLEGNAEHMLRGYPTFRDAMRAPAIQEYLKGLRQRYPLDRAQQLLNAQYGERRPAAPRPSDSFAVEGTVPPMPRPPMPPPLPLPEVAGTGPHLEATLRPQTMYPPGLPPTAPNVDLGEELGEGLLDLPPKGGVRVYRPVDEIDETAFPPATIPPGAMPPRPPAPPPPMNPHALPTLVPPAPPSSPHAAPTLRPPAPPPPGRPPPPPRPAHPLAAPRPTELPPQSASDALPPVTMPPGSLPPRPAMPAIPARPAPPMPARPVAPLPTPAPRAAIPASSLPTQTAWAEAPAAPPLAPPPPLYGAPAPTAAEPEEAGHFFIPLLLFVLVLALGLATAFIALVEPFVKGG